MGRVAIYMEFEGQGKLEIVIQGDLSAKDRRMIVRYWKRLGFRVITRERYIEMGGVPKVPAGWGLVM